MPYANGFPWVEPHWGGKEKGFVAFLGWNQSKRQRGKRTCSRQSEPFFGREKGARRLRQSLSCKRREEKGTVGFILRSCFSWERPEKKGVFFGPPSGSEFRGEVIIGCSSEVRASLDFLHGGKKKRIPLLRRCEFGRERRGPSHSCLYSFFRGL